MLARGVDGRTAWTVEDRTGECVRILDVLRRYVRALVEEEGEIGRAHV